MYTNEKWNITKKQIEERLQIAHSRYQAACKDMVERFFKRGDWPVPYDDMKSLPLPEMPPCPNEIVKISPNTAYIPFGRGKNRNEKMNAINRNTFPTNLEGTPQELVAAIRAADNYADTTEHLARKYREDTQRAIEDHVRTQYEAINELAAIVG